VANWDGVISAKKYPLYDYCLDSLSALTNKNVWRRFFSKEGASGIVMLGGGSATKDLVLIRSALTLLPVGDILQYRIVDISDCMAHFARQIVDTNLRREGIEQRVDIEELQCDFMSLPDIAASTRPNGKNVAWVIPGNTFGNINEREFLCSLGEVASHNDLFVIGTEIVDPQNPDLTITKSAEHYRIPAVRKFVSPALSVIWHEFDVAHPFKRLEKKIRVAATPAEQRNRRQAPHSQRASTPLPDSTTVGAHNPHSEIPKAQTIELSISLAKGTPPVTLLTSTKYEPTELVKFVESFTFKNGAFTFRKEQIIDTMKSPYYKQFVFRFVRSLNHGTSE